MDSVDFEVMKKYRFGKILDKQDRYVVSRLESTGLMKTGWRDYAADEESNKSHPDADIVIRDTASLTDLGVGLYYWEQVRRNPIRRWWCNFIHSV